MRNGAPLDGNGGDRNGKRIVSEAPASTRSNLGPGFVVYGDGVPGEDFAVDCMVICEAGAKKGWLRPTPWPEDYDPQDRSTWHYELGDYIRTDKLPHDQLT